VFYKSQWVKLKKVVDASQPSPSLDSILISDSVDEILNTDSVLNLMRK